MEFRDLKAQYLQNKVPIDVAIQNVLLSGNFIGGESVVQLENELAEYVETKHCITCANGTDALQMALITWNIGMGDAVFVPDFTFFSSGEVVSLVGATPVFVDIEKETFNISVDSLEAAIQNVLNEGKLTPKAVIAVDLFGQPANYEEIRKITEKYDLLLLEDGAQGFGGAIGNRRACSFGDISTTSFFPAKPLGCYGDGGAIFTDNDEWAAIIRSLCVHGKGIDKYDNVRIGLNSRLDTIQAAILLVKFKAFKKYELDAVNRVAKWYTDKLRASDIICPQVLSGYYSSWAQYTILLSNKDERDTLMCKLKEKGIPVAVYYQKPMHTQRAFDNLTLTDDFYPNSNYVCDRVLSLPMHPYLEKAEVEYICDTIEEVKRNMM